MSEQGFARYLNGAQTEPLEADDSEASVRHDYSAAGFKEGDFITHGGQRFVLQQINYKGGARLVPHLWVAAGSVLLDESFWPPIGQSPVPEAMPAQEREQQPEMPDFTKAADIDEVWFFLRQYAERYGNLDGVQKVSGNDPLTYVDNQLKTRYARLVLIVAGEVESVDPDTEADVLVNHFSSANNLRDVVKRLAYRDGHERMLKLQKERSSLQVQQIAHEQSKAEFEKKMEQWLADLPDGCVIKLHTGGSYRKSDGEFALHIPDEQIIKPDGRPMTMHVRYLKPLELVREVIIVTGKPDQWGKVEYISAPEKAVLEPNGGEATHMHFASILPVLYKKVVAHAENSRTAVEGYFKESKLGQRQVGDCFSVVGVIGAKLHKELYFDILAQSIKRENGVWKVRFLGSDFARLEAASVKSGVDFDDGWIALTDKDVDDWKGGLTIDGVYKRGAEGDLADVLLERARFSYESRIKLAETGQTMKLDAAGNLVGEGGVAHRALELMLSDQVAMKRVVGEYKGERAFRSMEENNDAQDAESLVREFAAKPDLFIITLASMASREAKPKPLTVINMWGEKVEILYKHGYALLEVILDDPREPVLMIQNPHVGSKPFGLRLPEALKAFRCFSYVQLHAEYKPYREVYEKALKS